MVIRDMSMQETAAFMPHVLYKCRYNVVIFKSMYFSYFTISREDMLSWAARQVT